jgi:hypothetical protein
MNTAQGASVINYNSFYTGVPDSSIKDSVKQFEEKLRLNTDSIELTRKDVQLLTLALKEIDQRTSSIERLPDGRTRFGGIVAGNPELVLQAIWQAATNYTRGNMLEAYNQATNGINRFEQSPNGGLHTFVQVSSAGIGNLYALAAISAFHLHDYESALKFGKQSIEKEDDIEKRLVVIGSLARLAQTNEVFVQISNAVVKFPNDSRPPFFQVLYSGWSDGKIPLEVIQSNLR